MSGVSIQRSNGSDGAFAVVRGMEPRYNNTLINGIKIASPDEKNRFVPLDIIPSDLLKRIEITKALTPDMEADAIGGTVNLVMKDAPDSTLFRVSGSIGYSQLFFDRGFESFDKSDIHKKSPSETNPEGYIAIPSDFSLSNVESLKKQAPPSYTAGITYGRRFIRNKTWFYNFCQFTKSVVWFGWHFYCTYQCGRNADPYFIFSTQALFQPPKKQRHCNSP